jgi:glutathione synthase/RimK-type ligase-like ATP-grasp enzyme
MKIGIHETRDSFSDMWIPYCEDHGIDYKLVDCYRTDIIQQLSDCDALIWHFSQNSPRAMLFARQLLYSVETSGKKVFPNFNTVWHFDDKVGQKYLLEAIGAPIPSSWVFYEKSKACNWVSQSSFPKVFKLRGGAGSQNVRLVKSKNQARRLIQKAFGSGFSSFDPYGSLKEEIRKYKLKKVKLMDLAEGLVRFILPPPYARIKGRDKGYIYFQEYIPGNDSDIRVVIIGNKAFAIKRMVRKNDFRASGSGNILYDKDLFDIETVKLSFNLADKLQTQCVAFDYVHDKDKPLVVEISYGFSPSGYFSCTGYWDKEMNWYEGKFNPYGWMVEDLTKNTEQKA